MGTITTDQLMIFLPLALAAVLISVFAFRAFKNSKQKKIHLPSANETQFKGLKDAVTIQAPKAPSTPSSKTLSTDSWWNALSKTREKFFSFSADSNSSLRESLEEACLVSDLGVANTAEALGALDWTEISKLATPASQVDMAKKKLSQIIEPWILSSNAHSEDWVATLMQKTAAPRVIWFIGVNGVGKTTSIAKLAGELKNKGHSVLLAAGDTFRAAAGEQLEVWAQRLNIDCVRGQAGADSSAVLFDAIERAKAKSIDFVLCDSAGRLHNQNQLMEALKKNRRVIEKACPGAPHEVLLVLDANTGQNMINQAEQFISSVGVTGLILTKLDGTARGGAVIAVARKTQLPIRRLGLGETVADFVPFHAERFSKALLGMEEVQS